MKNDSELNDAHIQLIKDQRIYSSSLEESASIIVKKCAEVLSVSRVSIWLFSEDQSTLKCLSIYCAKKGQHRSGDLIMVESCPTYFSTLLNSLFVDVIDTFNDPRTKELAESYLIPLDVKSLLDATLRYQGESRGVLCAEMSGKQRHWTTGEKNYVASIGDLVSQRLIFNQLLVSEEKYKALFDYSTDGIFVFSAGVVINSNEAACGIFQCSKEGLLGKKLIDISPEFQPDGQKSSTKSLGLVEACMQGTPQNFEWLLLRKNGENFLAEVTLNAVTFGGEHTLFALIRDITAKKETELQTEIAQNELAYRASHDSLTGLFNREQMHLYIQQLINKLSSEDDRKIALLLFDLNGFKEINDTLGHATGDRVLQQVARQVDEQVANANGRFFRIGGDEFVAIFDNENCDISFDDLDTIVHQWLNTSVNIDEIKIGLTASAGISLYPDNGQDSHELLRCADVAMYYAKNNDGVSPWYGTENDINNRRRLSLLVELRSAIREDHLLLHYQPRIDVKTKKITGCEALVRWLHPKLGLVPPNDFLPLAEKSTVIHQLSDWVLRKVFEQIQYFNSIDIHLPIAVNLSARNLADSVLISLIEKLLGEYDFPSNLLEIEITETALINYPQLAIKNLNRLNKLGLSIAIDDFGTGYSSIRNLKTLPFDTLKIDRVFVVDLLKGKSERVMVNTIVELGHQFCQQVIAEGVEDQETLDLLESIGCDQVQGYFIARPMPAEDFEQWLDQYAS